MTSYYAPPSERNRSWTQRLNHSVWWPTLWLVREPRGCTAGVCVKRTFGCYSRTLQNLNHNESLYECGNVCIAVCWIHLFSVLWYRFVHHFILSAVEGIALSLLSLHWKRILWLLYRLYMLLLNFATLGLGLKPQC